MADSRKLIRMLVGGAKVVLGAAFVYEGGKMLGGTPEPALLGGLGRSSEGYQGDPKLLPSQQPAQGRVVKRSFIRQARNIDDRVGEIRKLIDRGSRSPRAREAVGRILGRKCGLGSSMKWCVPEKDGKAEVRALFNAVHDPSSPYALRYTRDHVRIDQFASVDDLLQMKVGDCDDGAILLGALLTAAGYPIKLRIIQAKGAPSWSHIYVLAGIPANGPKGWVPLDWSVRKPAGWEVPGAQEALETGAPAGYVERTRDIPLYG